MHESCKNMLISLIKNVTVAPVRPPHPKENFFQQCLL